MSSRKRSSTIAVIILLTGLLAFQVYTFFTGKHSPTQGDSVSYFAFDPNTISHDSLLLLGFSDAQARGIENYRSKGGKFRKKEDFARMYTVSPEKYKLLEPFIAISDISSENERKGEHYHRIYQYERNNRSHDETHRKTRRSAEYAKKGRWSINDSAGINPQQDSLRPIRAKFLRTDTLDLNFADSADLASLRGIGGYYARRIIEYRNRLGFFYSDSQLLEIPGIDSVRFEGLRSRVTVAALSEHIYAADLYMEDTVSAMNDGIGYGSNKGIDTRMPLADLSEKEMSAHPYIGAFAARSMSFIRKKYGAAALTVENLLHQGIISAVLARKLSHYFK